LSSTDKKSLEKQASDILRIYTASINLTTLSEDKLSYLHVYLLICSLSWGQENNAPINFKPQSEGKGVGGDYPREIDKESCLLGWDFEKTQCPN